MRTIDVSQLPEHTLDHRSPIWWGNVLLLVIETVMFGILVAAYFYLRQNFAVWPPPRPDHVPVEFPKPLLGLATVNLVVLVLSCVPMFIADRAALRRNHRLIDYAMVATCLLGLLTIYLRWKEFGNLHLRWDDNAYASITWMTIGMHFTHLIVGTLENLLLTAWLLTHGLDDQHARDVRVGAVYWYWIAVIWVPLYALVYFGPRLL